MAMKHTKRHAFINVTYERYDDIIENQSLLKAKQKGKIKGLHLFLIWTHTTREKLRLKQVYTLLWKARSVSEQKKEAFHLHPVVSKSPLKTNKILWSFFPLWKSAINILQQMIIDFYKAIYRLLKSWLFNPLGARKEEFPEVRTACSFPHQHGQNLQTPDFYYFFFLPPGYFLLLLMLQCSSTGLTLLSPPTWDRSYFFVTGSWSISPVRYSSTPRGWRVGCSAE